MKVEFEVASDQIDGARDYQEDAYMVNQLGEAEKGELCLLVIMADGMGGHAAGNVASNMVVSTFNKTFQSRFPMQDVAGVLTDALQLSNDQVHAAVKETPALRGMGCTMVTAYLEDDNLYWVSVGDSHLYILREGKLEKKNADHSYGAYLDKIEATGTSASERTGLSRNMLMSAMTGEKINSVDVTEVPIKVQVGDRIIVASDGIDTLGEGTILQYCSWSSSAKECVFNLLKAVSDANKINQDNTTLIVIDVKECHTKSRYESQQDAVNPVHIKVPKPPLELPWRGFFQLLVLGLLLTGSYFSWQKGLVQQATLSALDLIESYQIVMIEPEPDPAPTRSLSTPASVDVPVTELETIQPKPLAQTEVQKRHRPEVFRDPLKSGGSGPRMVEIPGGNFLMGHTTGAISADETPQHAVTVKSFGVSVYEITYEEYGRFAQAKKRQLPNSQGWDPKTHPVNQVSWDDALAFTDWLSQQTGKNYRLLSEAEWEYVARAGTTTSFWWGPQAGVNNAHCFDCKSAFNTSKPAPGGTYPPNAFGVYDTAGNLFEWVHDCYHRNYAQAPDDGSVWESGDCDLRIVRGGAYGSPASSMRVENREKFKSNRGQYNVGIRVARDL